MLRVLLHSRSAVSASGGAWLSPSLSRLSRAPLTNGVLSMSFSPLYAAPRTCGVPAVGSRAQSTSSGAAGKAGGSEGNAGGGTVAVAKVIVAMQVGKKQ